LFVLSEPSSCSFSKSDSNFTELVAGCRHFEEIEDGKAYMISADVGDAANRVLSEFHVTSPAAKSFVSRVLSVMHRLHLLGFIHGDARLPNLVDLIEDHERVLKWIDYSRMERSENFFDRGADWMALLKSILRCLKISRSDAQIKNYISGVLSSVSADIDYASLNVESIVDWVFRG
jgi:tRNA A-37 threonylcarbamoyl transferase component Bud32